MNESLPQRTTQATPAKFRTVEELYNLYGKQAFGLALRVLEDKAAAEEAVHQVFLRYWRQPDLFSPQNGLFLNWLLREVHCYCLDRLPVGLNFSKNSRLVTGPLSTAIIFKKATLSTENSQATRQQAQVRRALAELPQEQRDIVELAYFKGMTHQQIAQATGQSPQTVRQNLAVGLVRLKRGITQLNPV